MKYGKIINGRVKQFKSIKYTDGGVAFNPTTKQWLENGYKKVIDNRPIEKDGFYQTRNFTENAIEINYIYNYVKIPIIEEGVEDAIM